MFRCCLVLSAPSCPPPSNQTQKKKHQIHPKKMHHIWINMDVLVMKWSHPIIDFHHQRAGKTMIFDLFEVNWNHLNDFEGVWDSKSMSSWEGGNSHQKKFFKMSKESMEGTFCSLILSSFLWCQQPCQTSRGYLNVSTFCAVKKILMWKQNSFGLSIFTMFLEHCLAEEGLKRSTMSLWPAGPEMVMVGPTTGFQDYWHYGQTLKQTAYMHAVYIYVLFAPKHLVVRFFLIIFNSHPLSGPLTHNSWSWRRPGRWWRRPCENHPIRPILPPAWARLGLFVTAGLSVLTHTKQASVHIPQKQKVDVIELRSTGVNGPGGKVDI